MSRFTDVLRVSPLADGNTWVLLEKFDYDIGREGSGDTIEVPVGFMTDFASVPPIFRALVSKWGKHGNATVIHDYCYWTQEHTKRESDDIFRQAMRVSKVTGWRSFFIYWAVRLGGEWAWRGNQKLKNKDFDRVAARLPEKAIDTPESLQAEQSQNKDTAS